MVTFRKSLLLLAIVAMMAAAGSAQVGTTPPLTCTANAGVPPIVRAEGLAELVGDVVLQCTGGIPTLLDQPVPRVNFRVFLNTTVTSKLLSGNWNEALLMIDEPQMDNPATPQDEGNGQRICTSSGGCTAPLGIGQEPGVNYKYAEYNVWQGMRVTNNVGDPSGGNTVEWLGVPIDPPGTQATRIIRITNIRANAAERGIGSGLIPTQLTMFISATGSTGFPITNPTVQVGFIQAGLNFSASGGNNFLQCESPDGDQSVTFSERFATAFKRRNIATTPEATTAIADQNIPGAIYNTETGFYNSAFTGNNTHLAGLATQGTQLSATFKNIPDGVTISVSQRNIAGNDQATLATSGSPLPWSSATGYTVLSQSGNQASAVWEIIGDNPVSNDWVRFGVRVSYTPNQGAGLPSLDEATVAGSYAPISTVTGASFTAPVPRFVDTGEDEPFFEIISCATNLLWPYVTNQAGFDTGMVISNTSMDPFGTVGQTGACTLNYYGNSDGGSPPASQTTSEIGPGGYAIWSLYNGGVVKQYGSDAGTTEAIAATAGFEGYVIAQCEFQFAHGYAFVSDLGASRVAQGYVALILDEDMFSDRSSRTGSKSERLDQ